MTLTRSEFATKKAVDRKIEELRNRRDQEINKLNKDIYILLGEINEQMIYEVQKANFQNAPACELFSQLERNFNYTVKADSDEVINFPEAVSGYIQDRLNQITKKQARIEKVKVQTQITIRTLDEMITF